MGGTIRQKSVTEDREAGTKTTIKNLTPASEIYYI